MGGQGGFGEGSEGGRRRVGGHRRRVTGGSEVIAFRFIKLPH